MADYDAFVLVSFGGPEGPADVIPFLENVTRGRGVPPERLAEVAHHYHHFGGVSPINQQCRDLLAAIDKDFAASGLSLPLYWGNRNWDPYLADTVAEMAAHGVRRAIAFVTSAYGSYFELPAVPRRHRERAGAGGGGRPADRQDPALLQPPRLHRPLHRVHPGGHRVAAARRPARCPAGVHGAQRAGVDGGGQRAGGRPVPGTAGGGGAAGGRGRRRRRRRRAAVAARLPEPERPAVGALARPGRAATTSPTWPPAARRAPSWSRWASSPTIWRSCTTSTWKRRRRPSGSASRWPARPPRARTRVSSP